MISVPLISKSRLEMVSPWSWNRSTITVLGVVCTIFLLLIYHKTIGLCLFECVRILWRRVLIAVNQHSMSSELCSHDGLSSAVLDRLPAIQFRKTDIECRRVDGDCPICLGEFMEGDWLRMLPKCYHVFHCSCIDAWFHSHSNCPLCRSIIGPGSDCRQSNPLSTMLGTLMREDVHGERGSAYHVHVSISLQGSPSPMVLLRTGPGPHRTENQDLTADSPSMTIVIDDQHVSGQMEDSHQALGSYLMGEDFDRESTIISAPSESDLQPNVVGVS